MDMEPMERAEENPKEITLIFVDHGGLRTAKRFKDTVITPERIMYHAKAYGGEIVHACLITDYSHFLQTPWMWYEEVARWQGENFDVLECQRRPQEGKRRGETWETKETIDFYLIQAIHKFEWIFKNSRTPVRFILVVGDEDYIPCTQTLHGKGFKVSIFLTQKCAFNDPKRAAHVDHIVLLYEQDEEDDEDDFGTYVHNAFTDNGVIRTHFRLTHARKKTMDHFSVSELQCPECGEKTKAGLWLTHKCHPARVKLMVNPDPEAGVVQPGFPNKEIISRTLEYLQSCRPLRFLRWFIGQTECETLPSFIRSILERVKFIPWEVLDVALLIRSAASSGCMEAPASEDAEKTLDIAKELNLLREDGQTFRVCEGVHDAFRPLIEEAERRSLYPHIARAIGAPLRCALTNDAVSDIVFEGSEQTQIEEAEKHARDVPTEHTEEILRLLAELSTDGILCWLADRSRVNRSDDEREAVKRALENDRSGPLVTWLRTLRAIETGLDRPEKPLAAADLIARHAGAHMTKDAVAILIRQGVLRRHESGSYTKGHAAHPAFTSFKHLIDTAHPRVV
jgi:hypothetical protein